MLAFPEPVPCGGLVKLWRSNCSVLLVIAAVGAKFTMYVSHWVAAATGTVAFPAADTVPDAHVFALSRVRRAANSISDRVREALTPDGFERMRVMVVDDHPDAAESLAAVLDLLGCPVRACYSGLSALVVAEAFEPQVCLLDLMMPGMDGLELAARLKTQAAGRPLLLVATTALGDAEVQALTALAGFHYHLTKPVDVCVLIEALNQLGKIITRHTDPETTTTD